MLDRKLLRDLRRLWAQALTIAGVIAGGVATLVLAVGSHHALNDTRTAYYERYSFADVFAHMRRVPQSLVEQIAAIPGVAAVDAHVMQLALLDIPDFREPATGQFISLPEKREQVLNRLYMICAGDGLRRQSSEIEHLITPGGRAAWPGSAWRLSRAYLSDRCSAGLPLVWRPMREG